MVADCQYNNYRPPPLNMELIRTVEGDKFHNLVLAFSTNLVQCIHPYLPKREGYKKVIPGISDTYVSLTYLLDPSLPYPGSHDYVTQVHEQLQQLRTLVANSNYAQEILQLEQFQRLEILLEKMQEQAIE
jgi:hypothetical protein